jgi:hypothetical protein
VENIGGGGGGGVGNLVETVHLPAAAQREAILNDADVCYRSLGKSGVVRTWSLLYLVATLLGLYVTSLCDMIRYVS